ncbi:hypothetical protein SPOG_01642 [Schizosaccharomyces cryophilus OY26]|uniref:Uncharacterized protein n=1 Tax=Schizosaccharomyces cryophilus (strain OY26 / ATCC MYA-4695 / CBS 11777 / NBRC 106824 / NRRL Y48691) TaxID=653667 RepID=S9W2R8_SCHCR|nr:uncharacterized protein SPOG_01642 [Schizosaccharomyces cryophilus OY26]EPY52315.1 hypothetical protein SPOG_01642 [Schizosaccharomyces cryophilus OY26]
MCLEAINRTLVAQITVLTSTMLVKKDWSPMTQTFMLEFVQLFLDCQIMMMMPIAGDGVAYLATDIDVLDPAYAPNTGTPESAGQTTRELRTILRGLDGIKS